ncbi:murein biosynthesis integral membrane protein MurJ [Acanthopleuribacter pedis]|uniref:Probable lipid II flippase MurJ n=1 Tax=Acanthopleuribacter pedis TaxID=442870 RepID=A0A8J7QE45_9BACT|nr:murein biosynthesis integral membrane protein MurJ [Acanthopleuribacter pedis]MBO1322509.1 murein biosynthesis integral membrane protein MurJ [Acanthopleuribacter pedis]
MSELKQFFRNSQVMAMMTACSRVFGLMRDLLTNYLLGTSRSADIWVMAFMLPNLFRRLMAEGVMSSAFVPILAETLGGEPPEEAEQRAREFARAMFSLILVAATLVVGSIILLMPVMLPFILRVLTPSSGGGSDPEFLARLILPTRMLFPYLIFISLAAICQGVLNTKNRFALPAFTPILLNICIISFGWTLRDHWDSPIWGLCIGVLCGGFLQFFLQWLQLMRLGFPLNPTTRMWTPKTAEAFRLWLPTTFSAGVVQINALVSTAVAVNLFEGASMALFNSNRMIELVLGVFAAAISTSILPLLARQAGKKDEHGMNQSLWAGLSAMSLVTLPAAVGLLVSGAPVLSLLFQRGAFDDRSLTLTYSALIFHSMALLPISWYRILSQSFYAKKKVSISVVVATIAAVVNMAGCFIFPSFFPKNLAHCGVALATLVSSWLLFALALQQAYHHFQVRWPREFTTDLTKVTAAALAFVPIWLTPGAGDPEPLPLILRLVSSILVYGILIVFMRVSWVTRLRRKRGKP